MKKEKESKNYTVPLSGAKYSDLCSIFVLPICKDSLLKPFMTNKMGQAKIFVGLQNYIDLLSSESFRNSFKSYIGLCCHRCTRRNAPGIDCCSSL